MNIEPDPAKTPPIERRARPRFDSSRIWDEASAMLRANREVLLAVLGVFCILPVFALAQFVPQPQSSAGDLPAVVLERWGQYFDTNWLQFAAVLVLQCFGTLVVLALLGDPARPTVGEALRHALRASPAFFAALAGANAAAVLAAVVPVVLIALLGMQSLALLAGALGFVVIIYMLVRFAFIGPLVMLGQEHNPARALRGSWRMTRGIAWQLLLFVLLIYVALLVIGFLLQGGFALVGSLLGGKEGALIAGNLMASAMQAVQAATFVAVLAAAYRQLGGITGQSAP